jgi:predicted DsbA family dithiol-disulfide isomerase
MTREAYLTAKFGSPERYRAIAQRVASAAAAEGLTYAVERIARQPNTLDCHRLILWAGESGKAGDMKQRLMELYFAQGGDLSDRDVLVETANSCGMDPELVRRDLATEKDVQRIEREADSAKKAGIDGVPHFILGGLLAVEGAQTPEHLAQAIDRAAEEYARRPAAE